MDSVINKLTEIESAASAIVKNAEAQKETLDKEYAKKRKQFDQELEQKTAAHLREIRSALESDTKELLENQTGASSSSIKALEREYETRHTIYAQEILKRITEV